MKIGIKEHIFNVEGGEGGGAMLTAQGKRTGNTNGKSDHHFAQSETKACSPLATYRNVSWQNVTLRMRACAYLTIKVISTHAQCYISLRYVTIRG